MYIRKRPGGEVKILIRLFRFNSACNKNLIDIIDTGELVSSSALVDRPSTHTSAVRVGPTDGLSPFLPKGCSVLSFYNTWVVTTALVKDSCISANWSFRRNSVTSSWASESDVEDSSSRLAVVVSLDISLWPEKAGCFPLDSTGAPRPFNGQFLAKWPGLLQV